VFDVTPMPGGFVVQFNRPINASELNLYDSEDAAFGPADVTLTGAAMGSVSGSLLDGTDTVTFIATGGPLAADTYTVILRSAANGFVDLAGELLDGNGNGLPGQDYVGQFTAAPEPIIVRIPDFARGGGQSVNVPATDNNTGLPLTLIDNRSGGSDVRSVVFSVAYDPTLLNITSANLGPDAPPGASFTIDTATSGQARLTFSSPDAPLPEGESHIVTLIADVPEAAEYGTAHLIRLFDFQVTDSSGAALSATADDAVHAVAYIGDTTGNQSYSGLDAQRAARVAVGLDTGFQAYPGIDPLILADITRNGALSGLDAQKIAQVAVGLDVPEIPPINQPQRLDTQAKPGFLSSPPADSAPLNGLPQLWEGEAPAEPHSGPAIGSAGASPSRDRVRPFRVYVLPSCLATSVGLPLAASMVM
jgi:hypothetical protein